MPLSASIARRHLADVFADDRKEENVHPNTYAAHPVACAAAHVAELDRLAWDRGAIVYARGTVLRLAPPLCITPSEVDHLVAVVADSVEDLERKLTT